ncbi:MAG: PKD domain-containing protein [Deltaproteobacteria bacterium]|nr:PKD domain-containing protein [Deltaproteobacteria bacterium]
MRKFHIINISILYILILLLSTSCGNEGGGVNQTPETIDIAGAVQKGPYVVGSSIYINELTNDGQSTGSTFLIHTLDNLGNFNFQSKKTGPVQIEATGRHLNELTGNLSGGTLTLRAIYEVSQNNKQKAFVNIMTHLISGRVLYLMSNDGLEVTEAIGTAESELLSVLNTLLPSAGITRFTDLNILENADTNSGNAYLLALSSIVYKDAANRFLSNRDSSNGSSLDSELTFLLNTFSSDFSTDGTIENQSLIDGLLLAEGQINPDEIRDNLERWSLNVSGSIMEVPDMNLFIDTDDDGTVNWLDDDDDNDGTLDENDNTPYGDFPNTAPIANAGPDQNVSLGTVVTLDGSGSNDDDGNNLSYRWVIISSPEGSTATLDDSSLSNPIFTADITGDYVIELDVFDGQEWSTKDSVTITANSLVTILANPISYTFQNRSTVALTVSYTYFTISLINDSGEPVNNTDIIIDSALSRDQQNIIQLYDNNTPVNAPLHVATDESGNYHLRVDFLYGGGLNYSGDISITSTNAETALISFSVSANLH